tara:strand:+ start:675 stop:1565 length:891 start_codon:yes stop_codon:yes gene_type:complete
MSWGAIAAGLAAVGIGLSVDAASQAKKALQKRLALRRAQMLVALKENDKVFGELGVAQAKHTSQRLRALADSSRGTLTANSMYGGGRGLFAEQASGMRQAAKDKARAILAIRAAYESDVDTSGVDAARAQIGASVIGLAGAAAGAAAGTKPPTEDAPPPPGGEVDLPAQGTTNETRTRSIQRHRDENRLSESRGSGLDISSESAGADKPSVAGTRSDDQDPKAGLASAAKRRRERITSMRVEREANQKRKTKTKPKAQVTSNVKPAKQGPMKGATKTENGVKYTYDGTKWVKNPTL